MFFVNYFENKQDAFTLLPQLMTPAAAGFIVNYLTPLTGLQALLGVCSENKFSIHFSEKEKHSN